jgi:hypothetical protein
MRKRTVLLAILGLTACLCWAIGSVVADQPSIRASSGASAQSATGSGSSVKPSGTPTSAQPTSATNKARAETQAPASIHLGGEMPASPGGSVATERHATGLQGAPGMTTMSGRILPVPASMVKRHSAAQVSGTAGPRDREPCMPSDAGSGACGPVVYSNLVDNGTGFYYGIEEGEILLDDIWLAGTNRELCSVSVLSQGAGLYSYTIELWTGCPVDVGSDLLYGPIDSGLIDGGSGVVDTISYPLPGVLVPTNFWIKTAWHMEAGATLVGPHITDPAEIGFSADQLGTIGGTPPACSYFWWGGFSPPDTPGASLSFAFNATGSDVGKCCYSDCTLCVDTTYGDCMSRPGNPEFMVGGTCAELPHCGKGACCLTTGVCVADKTEAECLALPNHLSWQLGTDCTAHGLIKAADCSGVPANDLCANAASLSGASVTVAFDNYNATYTSYTDDTVACLQDPTPDPSKDVPITNDVWYLYQIPTTYNGTTISTGKVIINTLGSSFDSVLAVYAKNVTANPPYACGNPNAITCADGDVIDNNLVGCNDDIIGLDAGNAQIQDSYVVVTCDGSTGPLPGGCLLIRIGSLNQTGGQGGPGFLNIDFIPTEPDPYYGEEGVCCLATGGCVLASSQGGCTGLGGYWRPTTDFYEGGTGTEVSASTCNHGAFGSCLVGEYCGNPVVLNEIVNPDDPIPPYPPVWTSDVSKVTYFKFVPRAFRAGDPGYPGTDPHYAMTIDTCGSAFDTVLTIYKGLDSGGMLLDSGDCDEGSIVKRNDDCSMDEAGAEGRVSCVGVYSTTSCVCLTVGTGRDLEANGAAYYIGVGKKDTRTGTGLPRLMGVDPAPNYPNEDALSLTLNINDGWGDCSSCEKNCCKGDLDGNGVLDGRDIQGFIGVLCGTALSCQEATWCRANMNGDSLVNMGDVPAFVNALLVPWLCDFTDYCGVTGYCQMPDASGGIVSDVARSTKIADNFVSMTGGEITRVCWWGFNAYFNGTAWGACEGATPADDFTVRFYSNVDNRPGDVLASFAGLAVTKTATGGTVVGMNEYKYEAQIPAVAIQAGDCIWLEISNNTGVSSTCWWLWETTAAAGDAKAAMLEYNYYHPIADTDLSFCVNVPIWDSGCVEYCEVPCPTGGVAEGEPECAPGYVDTYNAGCNMAPGTEQFTEIQCGQTLCGTTGIFDSLTPGYIERDIDWYKLVLTGETHVVAVIKAEFTVIAGFLQYTTGAAHDGDCANLSGYIGPWGTARCEPVILDTWLGAGTYYIQVVPDFEDPFFPDCGSNYTIKMTCTPCDTYASCLTCTGTQETETCGQTPSLNDGCNQTPDAYQTLVSNPVNVTVCGRAFAADGKRDTDWYKFTITAQKQVTAKLTSEFPGVLMVMKVNNCATSDYQIYSVAYSDTCTETQTVNILPTGTYVLFVSTGSADGGIYNCIPCTSTGKDYKLFVTTTTPSVVCTTPTGCQSYQSSPTAINADKAGTTQYKVADDFRPTASGNITHVCWWGVNGYNSPSWGPCTTMTSNFTIAFYNNNNGAIGTLIASRNVGAIAGAPTGEMWNTTWPIKLYQADITPAVAVTANTCYWIAYYNTTTTSCWFMALANAAGGAEGDDFGYQWNGTAWVSSSNDLGFCINLATTAIPSACLAPPPANDQCAGAIDITSSINGTNVIGVNSYATTTGDPSVSCQYSPTTAPITRSLWYKFTAPANGTVTVQTCPTPLPFKDSVIALFTGPCTGPTERFCNDDNCTPDPNSQYLSNFQATGLTPGTVYYLEVGNSNWSGAVAGSVTIQLTSP